MPLRFLRNVALSVIFVVFFAGWGSDSNPLPKGNEIGIVLMHGKDGDTRYVDYLAGRLSSADVHVLTPDMPWHKKRIYDKTFEDSMKEINQYVEKLRAQGVKKVFVAGHSLGAVAAAGYGATFGNIDGIILLAPGHLIGLKSFSERFSNDVARAEAMIKEGRGDKAGRFGDINMGKTSDRSVSADIYYSWFSPGGPADFATNMARLKNGMAVLYIGGEKDKTSGSKDGYAFDKAPLNDKSLFATVPSDHLSVPGDSARIVIDWLRKF